jgi:adenosylmethionine-8-amino-7-oxononanoate aminotransferase
MHRLAQLDHQYVWHPFTQMRDWLKREPIVILSGRGATLMDTRGRTYLDANSSIWTNLHGHQNAKIDAAIGRQLKKIAHTSALGLANEPASILAEQLVRFANPLKGGVPRLEKVFYSDNGSTAMEVAVKMAYEFGRRTGRAPKPRFLSLHGAYHGDTVGAVSLGHIDLFHKSYSGLLFKTDKVMAPYCYRCPFNKAKPERADARDYRQCKWECIVKLEKAVDAKSKKTYAGLVVEPLMQGAAGMIPQPPGWLSKASEIAGHHGVPLIIDEVMTGFGRAGEGEALFACHQEKVQPDFMAVSKGMTGGYMPLAATLASQPVFDVFLGDYSEFKTFFHGHSYTANPLACAAALASLSILSGPASVKARERLRLSMALGLESLWDFSVVGDIRQAGLIAGIELVRNWRTRQPFDLAERAGMRVCEALTRRGVLTRPIGNVLVLMPPYCTTPGQVNQIFQALRDSIEEVLSCRASKG